MNVKYGEENMNRNQRKNRPRKKEMPESDWDRKLREIKDTYEHGGKENRKTY